MPPIDRTVEAIRSRVAPFRAAGERIALVPTMGALHAGHMALVTKARDIADRTIASIFVNPTQFGAGEDYQAYPRDLDADLACLGDGADAAFVPDADEIYPDGFATTIAVAGPAEGLESEFRPGFFAGVATVVAKLLIAVAPDCALFGEKDYQQLLVVRRLVADLRLPVEIVSLPIVREHDGLALSSRNAYLSAEERARAPKLYETLVSTASSIAGGELAMTALAEAREALAADGFDVDYVELRDALALRPVTDQRSEPMRVLAAARLGKTRLIDNVAVATERS
jgi:pantoate--beta-alanine ligase